MENFDVVIVGAGPAGSTTAQYSAEAGLSVIMLDKREKVGEPVQCGEFIPSLNEMRRIAPKIEDMEELFNTDASMINLRTKKIAFITPKQRRYELDFEGYSVDRKNFDKHLAEKAVKAGADLRAGIKYLSHENGEVKTSTGNFKAKIIVGADGYKSSVARHTKIIPPSDLYSCVLCEVKGDFGDTVQMHFGTVSPGGYAWVIPKKGGANIGLGVVSRSKLPLKKMLKEYLQMVGAKQEPHFWSGGYVPVSGPIPQTVKNNVLVVGDAAGQVMATNGGGIPISMICGRIAGKAIGDHLNDGKKLSDYDEQWRNAIGAELENALKTKHLADKFFVSDKRLEFAMRIMGKKRMEKAILCKPIFP